MKKYFEYEFNDHIKERLLDYYSSKDGVRDFGNENGRRKTLLKLKRIEKYISFSSDDYICDIGCSDGSLLNCLKGKYKRATGLDISEEAIKKCKKNADQNVNFKAYNGSTIQSDILFDKIFAMDVLEHAFEPDELVSSIYKNLAWGGVFVIQVPSTGWLSELIFGKYHYGHLRYYDENYLRTYLEDRGFYIEYIQTFNSVPFSSLFLKVPALHSLLSMVCGVVPHIIYPYYGSVTAIAKKRVKK